MAFIFYLSVLLFTASAAMFGLDLLTAPLPPKAHVQAQKMEKAQSHHTRTASALHQMAPHEAERVAADNSQTNADSQKDANSQVATKQGEDDQRALSPVYPADPSKQDVRVVYPPMNETTGAGNVEDKPRRSADATQDQQNERRGTAAGDERQKADQDTTTAEPNGQQTAQQQNRAERQAAKQENRAEEKAPPQDRAEHEKAAHDDAARREQKAVAERREQEKGRDKAGETQDRRREPAAKVVADRNGASARAAKAEAPDNRATASDSRTALASTPRAANSCDVQACSRRYSSFRASDCTYQPYDGPRRVCSASRHDHAIARVRSRDLDDLRGIGPRRHFADLDDDEGGRVYIYHPRRRVILIPNVLGPFFR